MNPSSEREALLPCPFCEGDPMSNPVESMFHTFRIVCPHCEMCGPERMTASEAIAAWQGRAALSTQPQQAGWKMVPVEPSTEMLAAIETPREFKFEVASHDCNVGIPAEVAAEIYAAMLAAAPLPPVPGQEGGGV